MTSSSSPLCGLFFVLVFFFSQKPCPEHPWHSSSLRGPPGHGEDRIADGLELPLLHVGDWLLFGNMGAYTVPAASLLSAAPQPRVTYAMSRMAW